MAASAWTAAHPLALRRVKATLRALPILGQGFPTGRSEMTAITVWAGQCRPAKRGLTSPQNLLCQGPSTARRPRRAAEALADEPRVRRFAAAGRKPERRASSVTQRCCAHSSSCYSDFRLPTCPALQADLPTTCLPDWLRLLLFIFCFCNASDLDKCEIPKKAQLRLQNVTRFEVAAAKRMHAPKCYARRCSNRRSGVANRSSTAAHWRYLQIHHCDSEVT